MIKTHSHGFRVILNTELVRAVVESGKLIVYIRMANGKWAIQRPYDADLRGQIAALTLAIDALAGKIILQDSVQLDEKDFEPSKPNVIDVPLLEQRDSSYTIIPKSFGKKI